MKRLVRAFLAAAVVLGGVVGLSASPASAQVANGGFESPVIDPNAFLQATPTNWFLTPPVQGGNVLILNSPTFVVTEGDQAVDLSGLSPNVGAPTSGGIQQNFPTAALTQHTLSYDWTSKCAGSNVRVIIDGLVVDQATNPSATYPTYSTRTLSHIPLSPTTAIRFDTSTPGPTGASGQICGTIIDNVRYTAVAGPPTPTAAPASQCSGPSGHNVQFRKANFDVTDSGQADAVYNLPVTDPAVLAQATDNGVAVINYSDGGLVTGFASPRDVQTPPLTPVVGSFSAGADANFVMRSSGYLNIPTAGVWTFNVASDDGFRLLMGQPAIRVAEFVTSRGYATTSQQVNIAAPGCYHYELQWFNTSGTIAGAAFSATPPGGGTPILVGDTAGGGLAVFQGTDSPTVCKIVAIRPAPSAYNFTNDTMSVSISDLDGIGGVYNIQATNALISVFPTGWVPGTTGPIELRATKITQGQPAAFSFTVSDWNGNEKVCT